MGSMFSMPEAVIVTLDQSYTFPLISCLFAMSLYLLPKMLHRGSQKNSVKLSLLREDFNEMCRVIQSKGYKNFYKYVIPKIVVACPQG